jgi:hypothetical protein
MKLPMDWAANAEEGRMIAKVWIAMKKKGRTK